MKALLVVVLVMFSSVSLAEEKRSYNACLCTGVYGHDCKFAKPIEGMCGKVTPSQIKKTLQQGQVLCAIDEKTVCISPMQGLMTGSNH